MDMECMCMKIPCLHGFTKFSVPIVAISYFPKLAESSLFGIVILLSCTSSLL